jgi:hypothetical protein
LPPDPSSDLIFATRSGSTTPPDGPMPQPEQLKYNRKKIINQQNTKGKSIKNKDKNSEKVFTEQISTSAKIQKCPTVCNTETRHQQMLRKRSRQI